MKKDHFDHLVLSKDEYNLLRDMLADHGVNLSWSSTDCETYSCYIRNPYKNVVEGWGSDLQKELAKDFFERQAK